MNKLIKILIFKQKLYQKNSSQKIREFKYEKKF